MVDDLQCIECFEERPPEVDKMFDEVAVDEEGVVEFVFEREPTPEQAARAAKFKLPPTFYFYEDKPPCPGCRGCEEGDGRGAGRSTSGPAATASAPAVQKPPAFQAAASQSATPAGSAPVFGSSFGGGVSFADVAGSRSGNVPFSGGGFSGGGSPAFAGAGTQVFGGGGGGGGEEEEYDPHYEPVVPLPDKVEVKTGEENEDIIFSEMAKLFRYDGNDGEWKERGKGTAKLLKDKLQERFRFLMRREIVHKVCGNHMITPEMTLRPNVGSDRSWVWFTEADVADGIDEVKPEKLAIKLKNKEIAGDFKKAFESCVSRAKAAMEKKSGAGASEDVQPPASRDTQQSTSESAAPSLSSLFKPKAGSWDCPGCLVSNGPEHTSCPACSHPKPGDSLKDAPSSSASRDTPQSDSKSGAPSLLSLFKPKAGSWSCPGCLVSNGPEHTSCPACSHPKPGDSSSDSAATSSSDGPHKPPSTSAPPSLVPSAQGGLSLAGGFKLGGPSSSTGDGSQGGMLLPTGFQLGGSSLSIGGGSLGDMELPANSKLGEPLSAGGASHIGVPLPTGFKLEGFTATGAGSLGGGGLTAGTAKNPSSDDQHATAGESAAKSTPVKPVEQSDGLLSKVTAGSIHLHFGTSPPSQLSGDATSQPQSTDIGPSEKSSKLPSPVPVAAIPSLGGGKEFTFGKNTTSAAAETATGDGGGGKSGQAEEGEYDPHYEPAIPLPDKVEVKTGEEDDEVLFSDRARLFRFVEKEWKERGIGEMKVLKNTTTGCVRLLMRREKVMKVCANHRLYPGMEFKSHGKDKRAWVWTAFGDMADEEEPAGPRDERLSARFKNKEIADEFNEVVLANIPTV